MTKFALTQHRQRRNYVGLMQSLAAVGITATLASAAVPVSAQAQNNRALAGVAGGFAGGMLVGAAMAPRPTYYAPPPAPGYYAAPAPVYYDPPPARCYWTHGALVWDGYLGVYRRPSIRVCE